MKRLFGFLMLAFLMAWAFSPPVEAANNTFQAPSFDAVQIHQVNVDVAETFIMAPMEYSTLSTFWIVADGVDLSSSNRIDMRLVDIGIGLSIRQARQARHDQWIATNNYPNLKTGYLIAYSNYNVGWLEPQNLTAINNWQNLNDGQLYRPILIQKRQKYRRTKFLNS